MISITILTKNSQKHLASVLEALREFDDVVIADTGSTWLDYYPLLTNFRIRLYNNENGVPCFEFYKDNEQIDLYKFAYSGAISTSDIIGLLVFVNPLL